MNKKIWDIYAPIYEKAMRGDRKAYGLMYERIPNVIQGKDVLEVATGPGLLAKHVAHAANKMIAADYSDGMRKVLMLEEMPARITLAYVECVKQKKEADEGERIWKKSH